MKNLANCCMLFCSLLFALMFPSCTTTPVQETTTNAKNEITPFNLSGSSQSVKIPYYKSYYQFNGASPWYGTLSFGSNKQPMKFGIDTGNNANWVTSIQCSTPACTEPGRTRFDFTQSNSFSWIDKRPQTLNFGPWGDMSINLGQDVFTIGQTTFNFPTKTMLSINYGGSQFEELDWDGGLGFPAQNPDNRTSWLLQQLVNSGSVHPGIIGISFYMDPISKTGVVNIGDFDTTKFDLNSWLFFPLETYPGLDYLWTTPLTSWQVAGQPMGSDTVFVFDTGASDFKGDTVATNAAITSIQNYYNQHNAYPTIELVMGTDLHGNPGQLVLTSEQFIQTIEAGPAKGEQVIAIDTLDIPKMLLCGSVILEDLYTIFLYSTSGTAGNYTLDPMQVWLFNKKGGPKIIQNSSTSTQ